MSSFCRRRPASLVGVAILTVVMGVGLRPAEAVALGVSPCAPVSGSVIDPYGNPVAGATVVASDPGSYCGSTATATTSSSGAYTVQIPPGSTSDTATASDPEYASGTGSISAVPTASNVFKLGYAISGTASPAWVRSSGSVTFTVSTTAPPGSGASPGYVCAWGNDPYGQLGNGPAQVSTGDSLAPVTVEGQGGTGSLSGVEQLAEGAGSSYALLSNGTVLAWGENVVGQLGNGTGGPNQYVPYPVQVEGVGGTGVLSGVTALAASADTAYALLSDGTVVAWGYGNYGQLGNGVNGGSNYFVPYPVQVEGVGGTGTLGNVTALAGGWLSAYALLSDGQVVAWGNAVNGELGTGPAGVSAGFSDAPTNVLQPDGSAPLSGVTSIAASTGAGYALLGNGTELAWGYDGYGELGNGSYGNASNLEELPVQVVGPGGSGVLNGIRSISSGGYDGYVVLSSGAVYAFGDNDYQQLAQGNGQTGVYAQYSDVPLQVVGVGDNGYLSGATQVVGDYHSAYALLGSGAVAAWGDDTYGGLGDNGAADGAGSSNTSAIPELVVEEDGSGTLSGNTFVSGSPNAGHAMVIRNVPCPSTVSTTKVVADTNGTSIPMTLVSTSGGTSTWTGSYSPPLSTPDGQYQIEVCDVDVVSTGTCGQTVVIAGPGTVSPVIEITYGVDDTPPAASSSPGAYSDVTSVPNGVVSVTWTDPGCSSNPPTGSGVNTATNPPSLVIDGAPVSNTTLQLSGGSDCTVTITTSGSGIASGIHVVSSRATDNAGNENQVTFDFDLEAISDTQASAHSSAKTASVSSGANSVSISGVPVELDPYVETLSGSAGAGYGGLTRPLAFDNVQVNFEEVNNNTGVEVALSPKTASGTGSAPHSLAVLAPSTTEEALQVPSSQGTISFNAVPLPAGCITDSAFTCKATVAPTSSVQESASVALEGGALTYRFSGQVPVFAETEECVTQQAVCTATGGSNLYVDLPGLGWTAAPSATAAAGLGASLEPDPSYASVDPGCLYTGSDTSKHCGKFVDGSSGSTTYPCPPDTPYGATVLVETHSASACGQSDLGTATTSGVPNSGDLAASGVSFGCQDLTSAAGTMNLCNDQLDSSGSTATPYLSLYESLFLYSIDGCVVSSASCSLPAQPSEVIGWEQDHAVPASSSGQSMASSDAPAICPNGEDGSVTSEVASLQSNLTSASGLGSLYSPDLSGTTADVTGGIGAPTSSSQGWEAELGSSDTQDPPPNWQGPGPENTPDYEIAHFIDQNYAPPSPFSSETGAWSDSSGSQHQTDGSDPITGESHSAALSATSWWAGTPLSHDLEMFWGADFAPSSGTAAPALNANVGAEFIVDFACD